MNSTVRTSIIIPCYNEAARLNLSSFERIAEQPGFKLSFMNDGSTDETGRLLDQWCANHSRFAEVIHLSPNRGKAEAVRQGILAAIQNGLTFVGYADADLATPLQELIRLARILENSPPTVDVVLGSRIRRLGARIERNPLRHYLGRVFATVASLMLDLPVYDTQCGAKFFRVTPSFQRSVERPFKSRWLFDVELIGRLLSDYRKSTDDPAVRFIEVPLLNWEEVGGSKVNVFSYGRAAVDLVRLLGDLRSARHR